MYKAYLFVMILTMKGRHMWQGDYMSIELNEYLIKKTPDYEMYVCGSDTLTYYPSRKCVYIEYDYWCGDVKKTMRTVEYNIPNFYRWFVSNY